MTDTSGVGGGVGASVEFQQRNDEDKDLRASGGDGGGTTVQDPPASDTAPKTGAGTGDVSSPETGSVGTLPNDAAGQDVALPGVQVARDEEGKPITRQKTDGEETVGGQLNRAKKTSRSADDSKKAWESRAAQDPERTTSDTNTDSAEVSADEPAKVDATDTSSGADSEPGRDGGSEAGPEASEQASDLPPGEEPTGNEPVAKSETEAAAADGVGDAGNTDGEAPADAADANAVDGKGGVNPANTDLGIDGSDENTSLPTEVKMAELDKSKDIIGENMQIETLNTADAYGDIDGKEGTSDVDKMGARDYLEAMGGVLDGQLNNENNTLNAVYAKGENGERGAFQGFAFKHDSEAHGTKYGFISKGDMDNAIKDGKTLDLGGDEWGKLNAKNDDGTENKANQELIGLLDKAHDARKADIEAHGGIENYKAAQELRGQVADLRSKLGKESDPAKLEQMNKLINGLNDLKKGGGSKEDKIAALKELNGDYQGALKANGGAYNDIISDRISSLEKAGALTKEEAAKYSAALGKGDSKITDSAKLSKVNEALDAKVDQERNEKQALSAEDQTKLQADVKAANDLAKNLKALDPSKLSKASKDLLKKLNHINSVMKEHGGDGKSAGKYLKAVQDEMAKFQKENQGAIDKDVKAGKAEIARQAQEKANKEALKKATDGLNKSLAAKVKDKAAADKFKAQIAEAMKEKDHKKKMDNLAKIQKSINEYKAPETDKPDSPQNPNDDADKKARAEAIKTIADTDKDLGKFAEQKLKGLKTNLLKKVAADIKANGGKEAFKKLASGQLSAQEKKEGIDINGSKYYNADGKILRDDKAGAGGLDGFANDISGSGDSIYKVKDGAVDKSIGEMKHHEKANKHYLLNGKKNKAFELKGNKFETADAKKVAELVSKPDTPNTPNTPDPQNQRPNDPNTPQDQNKTPQ